jgi:hypothetical protein
VFWPRAITALLMLASVAATAAVLWLAVGGIRKRWARFLACLVLTIPIWFALATPLIRGGEWKLSDGRWCCIVCGALERRITYGDATLWTYSARESEVTEESRRFADWYWRTVRLSHSHDWMPVG